MIIIVETSHAKLSLETARGSHLGTMELEFDADGIFDEIKDDVDTDKLIECFSVKELIDSIGYQEFLDVIGQAKCTDYFL